MPLPEFYLANLNAPNLPGTNDQSEEYIRENEEDCCDGETCSLEKYLKEDNVQ
jgi:hypothetical protein